LLRLFYSTDHKVIGLLYGFTSLFFLLIGFMLVLIIRWQVASAGQPLPIIGVAGIKARAPYTKVRGATYTKVRSAGL
jgi:heme/copper-type cytochrome/quinol oxidase subunit 1